MDKRKNIQNLLIIIFMLISISFINSCGKKSNSINHGKYYLDSNDSLQYINIINDTELELVDFNFDKYALEFTMEDTSVTGNNISLLLQKTLKYYTEINGNRVFIFAQVTELSGMRLVYDPNNKIIELFNEKYFLSE